MTDTREVQMSANEEPVLGSVAVLRPEDGRNFWQPVPANGSISVRVAPGMVDVQMPFSLGTQTVPPGGYVREHAHPIHDEVLHFISGRGRAVVDGVDHVLEPGVTIFIGRNRRHMFINESVDTDMHWLWFIQPNGLEEFFEEIGRPIVPGEPDPTPFPRPSNVLEIEARTVFAPQPLDQRQPG